MYIVNHIHSGGGVDVKVDYLLIDLNNIRTINYQLQKQFKNNII